MQHIASRPLVRTDGCQFIRKKQFPIPSACRSAIRRTYIDAGGSPSYPLFTVLAGPHFEGDHPNVDPRSHDI